MRLLRDLVHVRLEDRDPLVSRILELRDDGLLLTAPRDDEDRVVPEAGTPLKIGLLTDVGVSWLTAVVTGERPSDPLTFGVRFLDAAVRRERRQQPRAKVSFPVEVASFLSDQPVHGHLIDVSDAGMRAFAPLELEPDDLVQMTIFVPEGEPVRLTASVARADPGNVYALAYGLFATGSRERLVEIAFRESARTAA